jgi:phage regulator Rha-like protein
MPRCEPGKLQSRGISNPSRVLYQKGSALDTGILKGKYLSIQTLIRVEATDNEVFDFLQVGEEFRIDSRVIAPGLGIEHKSFLETLRTYQAQIEHFGVMPFETAKPPKGSSGGRPETYVMLNRNQVLFAISLSRNTEQVVKWKMALIDALDQLEKQLALPTRRLYAGQKERTLSKESREIIAVLQRQGKPMYPKDLTLLLGKPSNIIRGRLFRMKCRGEIEETEEGYVISQAEN